MSIPNTTVKAIKRALHESTLAYQFAPSSYTFGAYQECWLVLGALTYPAWTEHFEAYEDSR